MHNGPVVLLASERKLQLSDQTAKKRRGGKHSLGKYELPVYTNGCRVERAGLVDLCLSLLQLVLMSVCLSQDITPNIALLPYLLEDFSYVTLQILIIISKNIYVHQLSLILYLQAHDAL